MNTGDVKWPITVQTGEVKTTVLVVLAIVTGVALVAVLDWAGLLGADRQLLRRRIRRPLAERAGRQRGHLPHRRTFVYRLHPGIFSASDAPPI